MTRWVEFRAGRVLSWIFLAIEPIIGLERATKAMAWLITHRPFYRRDVPGPTGAAVRGRAAGSAP